MIDRQEIPPPDAVQASGGYSYIARRDFCYAHATVIQFHQDER
jgi:hypothetical protein